VDALVSEAPEAILMEDIAIPSALIEFQVLFLQFIYGPISAFCRFCAAPTRRAFTGRRSGR